MNLTTKLFYFLVLGTAALASCTKTDQKPQINREKYIFSWHIHEVSKNEIQGNSYFQNFTVDIIPIANTPDSVYLYNFRNVGTTNFKGVIANGNLSIPTQTVPVNGLLYTVSGSGSIGSDNTLTYSYEGSTNSGWKWSSQCTGTK